MRSCGRSCSNCHLILVGAEIDAALAAADRRPGAKMIEVMLVETVQRYQRQSGGMSIGDNRLPALADDMSIKA